ncbi:XRE family transcriptional regulator [Dyadobacter bucti]|uniref:XRE family transcriptional regulator n=1 Tax=Dyadobacter bucti TaxID=2572203 RepID=UPI001107B876|nr:XRE family transcriptional regulator [Dyadobacter bucti]
MNTRQLIFAREYRGYTQSELSNSIPGLSQSNLSKFEKGMGTLSEEIQTKVFEFLNFPEGFFKKKINSTIENGNYRKRSVISKTLVRRFENKCRVIGYMIDEMSESINWPAFRLAYFDLEEGYSPKYVAGYTRKLLRLFNREPVKNIFGLLEKSGIIIHEIEESEKFDAVSFFTDKGYPIIILNRSFSNDRKRFNLSHELAHLLMHNELEYPIPEHRDKEYEANVFASEFLMPEIDIKDDLRGLKFSELADLKSYWLTSMSSLIRRARDLNGIDSDRYRYLMIEISRNGYSKKEPINVFIDKPTCFKNGYLLFREELDYSDNDLAETMALPIDIIKDAFSFDNQVHLRKVA